MRGKIGRVQCLNCRFFHQLQKTPLCSGFHKLWHGLCEEINGNVIPERITTIANTKNTHGSSS